MADCRMRSYFSVAIRRRRPSVGHSSASGCQKKPASPAVEARFAYKMMESRCSSRSGEIPHGPVRFHPRSRVRRPRQALRTRDRGILKPVHFRTFSRPPRGGRKDATQRQARSVCHGIVVELRRTRLCVASSYWQGSANGALL